MLKLIIKYLERKGFVAVKQYSKTIGFDIHNNKYVFYRK